MTGEVKDYIAVKELLVQTGSGSATLKGAGMVFSTATSVGNTDGTAEDLASYTVKANSMPAGSAKAIRVIAWGKTAADADAKIISIKFGSTIVATHASAGTSDKDWVLEATIIQGATGAQSAIGQFSLEGTSQDVQLVSTPAETETGDITLALNVDAINANDVLLKGMTVEFLN